MNLWQLSATRLSSLLSRGEVSAGEVVRAHLERVDAVDGRLRAFTEVLREQALSEADASDARRRRGEARGPLDGLPMTIKECFEIAGRATTLGLPSWRGRIAARDAAMVTLLREAGAVLLGRTNLSQTMLYVEARNPIFGQTANPWSSSRSPGGSSGGEAAAIAAGMSPLGVGTDIGGSIRTPAHFCGICGFKPTLDRLPMRGYQTVLAGQEAVRGMGGPLARTVDDSVLFFRSLDPRALRSSIRACRRWPGTTRGRCGSRVCASGFTPTTGSYGPLRRSRAPWPAQPRPCGSGAATCVRSIRRRHARCWRRTWARSARTAERACSLRSPEAKSIRCSSRSGVWRGAGAGSRRRRESDSRDGPGGHLAHAGRDGREERDRALATHGLTASSADAAARRPGRARHRPAACRLRDVRAAARRFEELHPGVELLDSLQRDAAPGRDPPGDPRARRRDAARGRSRRPGEEGGGGRLGQHGSAGGRAGRRKAVADHVVLAAMRAIEAEVSRDEGFPLTPVEP